MKKGYSLNQHLSQYLIDISVDTLSTLEQKLVDNLPRVKRLISIDWKLVDFWLTVDQDVYAVVTEWPTLRLSKDIDWLTVSMDMWR